MTDLLNGVTESIEMLVIPDTILIQRPPTCGIVLWNGAQKWRNDDRPIEWYVKTAESIREITDMQYGAQNDDRPIEWSVK